MTEEKPTNPLFDELLWVHSRIRRDLETVTVLADETANGLPPEQIREAVSELKTNGYLWRLKVNCLQYCHFVHSHHGAEDAMLFPYLRKIDPEHGPMVDRLEAEHRVVSDILDEIESAADDLIGDDSDAARERVRVGLQSLTGDLLAHLEFEEESLEPVLAAMPDWRP